MPKYTVSINGKAMSVEADPDTPLLWVLRDHLDLVGIKFGCGVAQCGACMVHMNDNRAGNSQPVFHTCMRKIFITGA